MINIKYIKNLPFYSVIEGQDILDCALWESKENICELQDPLESLQFDGVGSCDNSGFYYGTSTESDPKFCARHFYLNTNGDGKTNYRLIEGYEARERGLI